MTYLIGALNQLPAPIGQQALALVQTPLGENELISLIYELAAPRFGRN